MSKMTLKERVFYGIVCSEGRVYKHWYTRFLLGGMDLGPRSLWVISSVLVLNLLFILLLYKELKLATFDAVLAAAFGFTPLALNYLLMALVSIMQVRNCLMMKHILSP